MNAREQFTLARRYARTIPSLFNPAPSVPAPIMRAAVSTVGKRYRRNGYGCDCVSCKQTNAFINSGFESWPCDAPKGKRASDSEYRSHVNHLWAGVAKGIGFKPGQAPIYPPAGINGPVHSMPQWWYEWNKKTAAALATAARPAHPCKGEQHFPAQDRPRETAVIYAMPKAKPEGKRPVGRPPMPGRRVVIKLEEEQIKRAVELGKGNMAEGIRKALGAR